jgi:hypothetical protein
MKSILRVMETMSIVASAAMIVSLGCTIYTSVPEAIHKVEQAIEQMRDSLHSIDEKFPNITHI